MSIWSKLATLARAGVREPAEGLAGANALRIYRQEIREAGDLLERRRETLAAAIAERKSLEREIEALEARIAHREQALRSLPPGEQEEQLLRCAAREIAGWEEERDTSQGRRAALCTRIAQEETRLRVALRELSAHQRELRLLASAPRTAGPGPQETLCGRLAALRESRASLGGSSTAVEDDEAAAEEALQRVQGDTVERKLVERGLDAGTRRENEVLARLRGNCETPA